MIEVIKINENTFSVQRGFILEVKLQERDMTFKQRFYSKASLANHLKNNPTIKQIGKPKFSENWEWVSKDELTPEELKSI